MGARFVRLGIVGFKSFADPATLEILPGLTGVVGPNGCGKSNVAEALRWAMGEANARHLRGGEMDDVIFAGTAHRPSRNLAEVSLHIEGEDGDLPPPFAATAELQVVRRIERGGGSAYRVNGREARARDVQTLFADLASGARSSAMVSQGRVGALVNARPEERRAVLEEAAGITGLHARRAEAETRLRAAEANLERAEERRAALDRQLDGLRGQAKQAARYRTVTDALLETEAALLAVQRARAERAVAEADASLRAADQAVHRAAETASACTAAVAAAHAALPALREAEASERVLVDRARLAQEGIAAEAARAEAALIAATQRRAQLARDLAHAEVTLRDAESADTRLAAESEALHAQADAHPGALATARAEADEATAAMRDADQRAADSAALAAEATVMAEALRQGLDQADGRLRRAEQTHARLRADRERALAEVVDPARLDAASQAHAAAEQALADARAAQDRADTGRLHAAAQAAAARDTHARLDAARHRLAAQASALAEVLAVKDNERWKPMVDRLAVPAGLEAALGAALGEELAAADDPNAARHWRALPAPPHAPGSLAGLVKGPPILARALAGIALVETDADGDAAQAGLQPGQSLVSAQGAVWRWDGYTVRAGTPTAATVRLQQRNRLAALRTDLETAERDAAAAKASRDQSDRAEREAVAAEQATRLARRDAEAAVERTRAAAQALHARAQAAATRLQATDDQVAQLAPELATARDAHRAAQEAHAARRDPAALRAAADAAKAGVNAARARESAAARALDALHRADQARIARLHTIHREREDRRMRAADLAGRVTDLAARATEAAAEHERLVSAPSRSKDASDRAAAALSEAQARHASAVAARERAERAASDAAAADRAAAQAVFTAREALIRAEAAQQAASLAMTDSAARIAEREGALPPFPIVTDASLAAEDRARNRLHRLTRERDEMGPVNLRADIEAQAIEADIAAIIHDRDELGTAIAKLRGSIGHLNREGRERLSAIFQQVDRHFQALFTRMFGGGRAHLALVGSDDPLQAGLEIFAQPPGKKLASLALLSGGEQALTALCLIFAVFRCNPAPLCVLDEVDAPLDDANVERFCALLADIVQETGTRFLVVTHHQLTMARMDRLYGVTMQERGVSRLLSVDLSRAQGMVEAVAAE